MEFKEGDSVIVGGYSGGAKATIMKVLENSNRYRVKTEWNGRTGSIIDESDVHKTLKDYHGHYISFAKGRIEMAERRFNKDKTFFENKITKSEEYIKQCDALGENDGEKE